MAKFSEAVFEWSTKMPLQGGKVMRKLGLDAYSGILKRSPVRTGRFRGSNRISLNKVDKSVLPLQAKIIREKYGTTPDGQERAYASASIRGVTWGDTIHITNNLVYARFLENGGSRQNGNAVDGIYGATFAELKAKLNTAIEAAKKEGIF